MSQRDRHAESGAVAVSRTVEATSVASRPSRDPVALSPFNWEERFPSLSAATQERLLNSARQQGFLLAEQIPTADVPERDSFRNLLHRTFATSDLTPVPFVDPIEPFDAELDAPQRDAVARALQTPDLLLIQGLPGTGKSRIIVEIIRQASSKAIRVLFLAPSSAAIDVVLNQLNVSEIVGVRTLSKQERADSLAPSIGAMTWRSREQYWRSEWLKNATEREKFSEIELNSLRDAMRRWSGFEEIATERSRFESERAALLARRESTDSDIRSATRSPGCESSFGQQLRQAEQNRANRLAAIEADLIEAQKQRSDLLRELDLVNERLESLRPLEDASHSSRFWSMNFWKARLNKALPEQFAEALVDRTNVEDSLTKVGERDELLRLQRVQADDDYTAEKDRLIAAEIKCRQLQIDEHLARIEACESTSEVGFRSLCDALRPIVPIPASSKVSDVCAARIIAEQVLSKRSEEHEHARRWREFVENDSQSISGHYRATMQFVAGPLSSQSVDSWFADPNGNQKFDLLIIDEAHLIPENELAASTKRADRWVFLGEPSQPVPAVTRSRPVLGKAAQRKNSPSTPSLFTRLWDELHHETWIVEADRLCCRLHPVAASERRHLEKETVEDRADIELRILNRQSGDPELAEVLFPPKMCIAEAKEYLFRELGEIPCLFPHPIRSMDNGR